MVCMVAEGTVSPRNSRKCWSTSWCVCSCSLLYSGGCPSPAQSSLLFAPAFLSLPFQLSNEDRSYFSLSGHSRTLIRELEIKKFAAPPLPFPNLRCAIQILAVGCLGRTADELPLPVQVGVWSRPIHLSSSFFSRAVDWTAECQRAKSFQELC